MYPKLVLNLLCTWGWPWISGPASTSCMLGSQRVPAHSLYMVSGIEPRTVCKLGEHSTNFRHACPLWFSWALGSPCASGFSLRCSVVLVLSPHPTALTSSSTWASLGPLGYSVLGASEMPHRAVSVINHRLKSMSECDSIKTEASKWWPSFIWSANAIRTGLMPEGVS